LTPGPLVEYLAWVVLVASFKSPLDSALFRCSLTLGFNIKKPRIFLRLSRLGECLGYLRVPTQVLGDFWEPLRLRDFPSTVTDGTID